jgi:NADH-quinone oxidoreductase subunit L
MTIALGASAYGAGIFHLMTHAFFKAVLFLGAGSVIVAMHHEQDMRKMGGLRKYMPITYLTVLIGALANAAFPGFAGFFSKDLIIEAVHESAIWGSGFAYACALACALVTAFYTFRMVFLAFHGTTRMDAHTRAHVHESPWVIWLPLVLLAIPSILAGYWIDPIALGDFFGSAIVYAPEHPAMHHLAEEFHGVVPFLLEGLRAPPFWLTLAGILGAVYMYLIHPASAAAVRRALRLPVRVLENKYGLDDFNQAVLAGGAVRAGNLFWKTGDVKLIDGLVVNGAAHLVGWFAGLSRRLQSGYIYHYAFAMIAGAFVLLTIWLWIEARA